MGSKVVVPQSNQRGIETRCGRSFLSEEVRVGNYVVTRVEGNTLRMIFGGD